MPVHRDEAQCKGIHHQRLCIAKLLRAIQPQQIHALIDTLGKSQSVILHITDFRDILWHRHRAMHLFAINDIPVFPFALCDIQRLICLPEKSIIILTIKRTGNRAD